MKVWSFQLLNVQYKCVYVAMVIYYGNFDSPNNPNMEVIGVCKKKNSTSQNFALLWLAAKLVTPNFKNF